MSNPVAQACSFLFVPATHPERFQKALASGADLVIADWEDAVAPADKAGARAALLQAAAAMDAAQRARLLVESVAGLHAVDTLATAPQVARLAFGHLDFQVDAGMACGADEAELLPVRMALVLASRRAGLAAPVDGVTVDTRDPERMRHDANRARRMGFGAKLCIHPAQVAPLHAAFDPDDAAVAQALRVQQALRDAGGGVCVLDGRMVDAPVLLQAEQTLARHARAQQRDRR